MWSVIPSLEVFLQGLSLAFTSPSFETQCQIFLGWVLCLGRRTEYRVFETIFADEPVRRNKRHPFDRFYNFFNRSAWHVSDVARTVAVQVVTRLNKTGVLTLVVDDTLLHKSGKMVFGIGWFHDPVASSEKREVTALGNSWVVIGLAVSVPFTRKYLCLPIHARLRQAGTRHPGPAELAYDMLREIVSWFPERQFLLIGDGGYSSGKLLQKLPPAVTYVGLMRGDAALHSAERAPRGKGKRGPDPKYGRRIAAPRDMAKQADRSRKQGKRPWNRVTVTVYGKSAALTCWRSRRSGRRSSDNVPFKS